MDICGTKSINCILYRWLNWSIRKQSAWSEFLVIELGLKHISFHTRPIAMILFLFAPHLTQWANKVCSPCQFHYHIIKEPHQDRKFSLEPKKWSYNDSQGSPSGLLEWSDAIIMTPRRRLCLLSFYSSQRWPPTSLSFLEIVCDKRPGGHKCVSHCQLIKKMRTGDVCENCFKGKKRIPLILLVKRSN